MSKIYNLQTETLTPDRTMILACDDWYSLLCKRIKEEQAVGHDVPFTLISALHEGYFNNGAVKSSEGHQVRKANTITSCALFPLYLVYYFQFFIRAM